MSWHAFAFTGGYNDALHPSLLDEKTASVLIDAQTETGKLRPVLYDLNVGATPEALGHYGSQTRSTVKWYGRWYWSDNYALTYGSQGDTGLGIPYPESQPTLEAIAPSGDGLPAGVYRYCITYMNEHEWEGAPGSLTEWETSITLTEARAVRLTFPETPAGVSWIRVWRTAAEGAEFSLVARLAATETGYTDELADSLLVMGESLSSQDNYPPPSGGRYLTESGGVFYLAVNTPSRTELHFSALGNPHAWPTLNFIGFGDSITGIVPEFEGVLVFTRNGAYRVTGADNPDTVVCQGIPGNQGCIAWQSISQLDNMPMWLSADGLCAWDGESVQVLSLGRVLLRGVVPVAAAALDGAYYLFTTDGVIVYDSRSGGIFRRLSSVCDHAWHDTDRDCIFLTRGDATYQLNAGRLPRRLTYRTGHVGESELLARRFMELLARVGAETELKVMVDGREVLSRTLPPGRSRLKLPDTAVGAYAEIELQGDGDIEELALAY